MEIYFMQPDTPMPMNGMVCYINASNFQGRCLLQYWKNGQSLWILELPLPEELITDSMSLIKLGLNFSGPKPLSPKARQWVMEQKVYIPLHIQTIEAIRLTGVTAEQIAKEVGISHSSIYEWLNQKHQIAADKVDKILEYLTYKA